MGLLVDILILLVLSIGFIVSLVYITKAKSQIADIPGYDDNQNLITAHSYLTWTVVILWILLALVAIGMVLLLIFGPEFALLFHGLIINGLLFSMIGLSIAVGVMSILALTQLKDSGKMDTDPGKIARTDLIIAASVSLGMVGILIIGFVIYHFQRVMSRKKHQKELEEKKIQQKEENKETLDTLKIIAESQAVRSSNK